MTELPGDGNVGLDGSAVPGEHKAPVKELALESYVVADEPQTPSIGDDVTVAVHVPEFVPPFGLSQTQVTELPGDGNVGLDGSAVPGEHKAPVKELALESYVVADEPQTPSIGDDVTVAVHVPEFVPPFGLSQTQVTELPGDGNVGLDGSAVPGEHKAPVKELALESYVVADEPQTPSM